MRMAATAAPAPTISQQDADRIVRVAMANNMTLEEAIAAAEKLAASPAFGLPWSQARLLSLPERPPPLLPDLEPAPQPKPAARRSADSDKRPRRPAK